MSDSPDTPIEDDNEDVGLDPDDSVFVEHAALLDALAEDES